MMARNVGSNAVFANLGCFSGLKIAAGITIAIAFSTYFSGILWTTILGLSVVAVIKALPFLLNDGDEDQTNSFENLYNSYENSPKQRRMLAKKKVNHLSRNRQSKTDFESSRNTSGINLSSKILEELEYSVAEDFDSTRKLPQNGNHRQQIPSLRSQQPLLSAVKTRICIRDSKRSSPIHPFGNKYPDHPRREVLRDLKNATSPNSVQLLRDSLLASGRSQDIFKAMSPPSGRFFSRINPEKTLNNLEAITLSPLSDSILEQTWSKAKKTEERIHEDSCSRAAVVKALQEKITSKRKRNLQSHADLSFDSTIDQTNMQVKKRRLDTDIMDSSTDDIFPSYFKDNMEKNEISQNFAPKALTKRSSEADHEDNKRKKLEKSSVIENSTSKYGMKDTEIDLISDEDEMIEVPNKQNKRKSKIPIKASKKGKKDTVIKGATLSKIAKNMVKKTPVKSVETQTPSKLETEANDEVKSPKNPKLLKTPYRKIFSSGFPSNLKPGSTEKRRRIPIFSMSAGDLETIEISREEYGERGVTSEVFQAAKKTAAERASKMLDDHEDEEPTTTSPSSISSTISTSGSNMVQSSAASSLPSASISLTATTTITTGFTVIKEGTAENSGDSKGKSILFGKQLSPSKTEISFGAPQTAVSSSSIVKPFGGGNGLGFGLTVSSAASQSAQTLNAAIPSSLGFTKPTEPSQSKVATGVGGFKFGTTASASPVISSGFSSTASGFAATTSGSTTTTSGFAATTSGFAATTPGFAASTTGFAATTPGFAASTTGFAATTSGFAASTTGFAATTPGFAASTTGFATTTTGFASTTTGFASTTTGLGPAFGFTAAAKPGLAALSSSNTTALLGTSSNAKTLPAQPSLTPKSLVAQQAQASAQQAQTVAPQLGGFSMGPQSITKPDIPKPFSAQTQATAALPSVTSSTQSFGGFSFGAASTQKPSLGGFSFGNSSVAASSAPAAGFSFNASTASTSSTLPTSSSGGGFSFGAPISSQQAPATASFGAKSTPATSAPFGGFSFGATKTQTGFSFGNTSTVTTKSAPQNPIPVPFGTPAASTQTGSASIFNAVAAASSASNLFGQKGSDAPATSNLFGAASQSSGSVFGSVPQTAKASAPLFGTPAQSTTSKAPLFGAVSQNSATSTLFGAKPSPATTSVTPFGASNAAPSLSFGSKSTNIFGAPTSQTPSTGGFSFTNSPQSNPASGAQNLFGQTGANAGAKFSFGQSASNSNPFSGSSAFGQPAANPPATTAAFAFGQSATPSFGQPVASQSSFGASATPAFGNNANQTQSAGFSFGSAPKPNLGGFAFSSGAASGGFTSRPGTPTPLAGNQPAMQAPGGMPGSMFGTPQPQGAGFALGSGSTANRQQIKGKRRTRR